MSFTGLLLVGALLVSRATGVAGVPAHDDSINASISADGRYVAFASIADNLSDEDNDVVRNIYVRDLQTGTTTYVSRASGVAGEAGDGFSAAPSISADGRFVAFTSVSENFTADDAKEDTPDVFVRDLQTNTTTFVSRASGPAGAGGDASSEEASISADGRFVAFHSVAGNLGDGSASHTQRDIFVRDLQQHTTTFVSRADAPADGYSLNPSISADGRYVAFESFARNLSDADADGAVDVFVRDLQQGTTTYVSRGGDANSYAASISADGRLVAFGSDSAKLDPADVDGSPSIFVRDLHAGTTRIVSGAIRGGALGASLSADGRFVAFEQEVNDTAGEPQPGENIFVHDLVAKTTAFVGRASPDDGEPPRLFFAFPPSISSDGRFVAFESEANSLSAEDDDRPRNVFVRDLRPPTPPPGGGGPAPGGTVPPRATPRCAGRRATIVGTPGRDRLRGTRRADVIVALRGNDRVAAGAGRDIVCGGAGDDHLIGGRGRDRLLGGPGRDRTKS